MILDIYANDIHLKDKFVSKVAGKEILLNIRSITKDIDKNYIKIVFEGHGFYELKLDNVIQVERS